MTPPRQHDDTPFERIDADRYAVRLPQGHRDMIANLMQQLSEMIQGEHDSLYRLFPTPYGDDTERNEGYAVLAGAELHDSRIRAISAVIDSINDTEVDTVVIHQWMRTINDLRLVLGTMLEIDDDGEVPEGRESEDLYDVYEYLAYVLEWIVHAIE